MDLGNSDSEKKDPVIVPWLPIWGVGVTSIRSSKMGPKLIFFRTEFRYFFSRLNSKDAWDLGLGFRA